MLNEKSLRFDTYNVWCGVWFIPTHRELYILNNDGEIIAKFCVTDRTGEWPMWTIHQIANVVPVDKKAAFDSIVRIWQLRISDRLVDIGIKSHRRSAALDN
jgi:hypothetical protein